MSLIAKGLKYLSSSSVMTCHSPLLLLLVGIFGPCSSFKICAFNVQNFDDAKSANFRVIHTLTRIVSRCDICLLQEVKDTQGNATKALVEALNRYDAYHYKSVASGVLGRTPQDQEQYVYLYRNETVELTDQYQYVDRKEGNAAAFSRDPFVVRFQAKETVIGDFALIPLHTMASDAIKEIDKLYDVFEEIKMKWNTEAVMFLGAFNAGCGHMTRQDKANIRLFSIPGFFWLIRDQVDTTVGDTASCAYDRIVVHGERFLKAIKPYSAQVFNIANEYKLSKERVLEVSDHFPIEVELKTKSSGQLQAPVQPLLLIALSVITSALHILPSTSMV
ncbi:deoxyribonuclease gamma isoform X1 [Salmo salar]|uniref:Deoxyribonuclease-1-like 1 n=2 Tax=Salmo salar TaxID=8030 RepID=A0ABM3CQS6_SALSA|nr:deoxyribonuclease gamma isoform X1 [Salmo salar]|eukprot:XP_013990008.1 PREDICTED: deoxyribonuclease gamma-like isoform X1 [Salmo salar]